MTPTAPVLHRARARRGRAPPRRWLRLAASSLLLAISLAAFTAGTGLLILRRELHSRDDSDTRPCTNCRSPSILDGRSLTDEQGQRLLFATPEEAARYAADYGKAQEPAR